MGSFSAFFMISVFFLKKKATLSAHGACNISNVDWLKCVCVAWKRATALFPFLFHTWSIQRWVKPLAHKNHTKPKERQLYDIQKANTLIRLAVGVFLFINISCDFAWLTAICFVALLPPFSAAKLVKPRLSTLLLSFISDIFFLLCVCVSCRVLLLLHIVLFFLTCFSAFICAAMHTCTVDAWLYPCLLECEDRSKFKEQHDIEENSEHQQKKGGRGGRRSWKTRKKRAYWKQAKEDKKKLISYMNLISSRLVQIKAKANREANSGSCSCSADSLFSIFSLHMRTQHLPKNSEIYM